MPLRSTAYSSSIADLFCLAVACKHRAVNGDTDANTNGNRNADKENGDSNLDEQLLPLRHPSPGVPHRSTSTPLPFASLLLLLHLALHQCLLRRPHLALFVAVHADFARERLVLGIAGLEVFLARHDDVGAACVPTVRGAIE